MTEAFLIFARPGHCADAAAHGVGEPIDGLEVALVRDGDHPSGTPITPEAPGRMLVRGAHQCLATLGRDSGTLTTIAGGEHDGWYDTGDLASYDERYGYRLIGRAVDRIGGAFMIPVADVEDALRAHPSIADAALIGVPDGHGGEVGCAVVATVGDDALTLDDLRDFLLATGMTEWYIPQRLELVPELPRNATGKVEKHALRRRLRGDGR